MSQKSVEIVIGRLATDEELRARFREAPDRTLHELTERGLALTKTEIAALLACGSRCIDAFVGAIDPRLEKACLKPGRGGDERAAGDAA